MFVAKQLVAYRLCHRLPVSAPFSPALLRQGEARSGNSCSSGQLTRELTPDSLPFLIFLTEVELIYNIVFISAVQQSGSVIRILIHAFFVLMFFPVMVYQDTVVLSSLQEGLVVYPSYMYSLHLLTTNSQSIPSLPTSSLTATNAFSLSMIPLLFCR